MVLFESMLVLVVIAIGLLQLSRRFVIPYPTMLAMAGVAFAALPWSVTVSIDPQLALALFIAPALLDAAYDLPPRALLRYWLPLLSLAAVAVILTTIAVAGFGIWWAGLPIAAAIALGAIVAPPDAAAATAILSRFNLPRNTVTILRGEGLLNDAVALLIFGAAVASANADGFSAKLAIQLTLAVPGGIIMGIAFGRLYAWAAPHLAGTLGGTLFEFVATFGVWILAEHLHVSAILSVVTYAMTVARFIPERQSAGDRVHSYSVWEAAVFLLNVLAFLLMGLQAREIVGRLSGATLTQNLVFAGGVLLIVIGVRIAWVMIYNRARHYFGIRLGLNTAPTLQQGVAVAWCGMRGMITLAAALSLPSQFPGRDTIILSAFAVVIGTLVGQGLTLGPLVKWLKFEPDGSFDRELADARAKLLDAAIKSLGDRHDKPAQRLRDVYQLERRISRQGAHPREVTEGDKLRRRSVAAMRDVLTRLRKSGHIDDDVFHALEQELDLDELAASPADHFEQVEG